MTQRFRPLVEQLEGRLLLAGEVVGPDPTPAEPAQINAVETPSDLPQVIVSIEPQVNCNMVVVCIGQQGQPSHFVSVIGGEAKWTDPDGFVRFQIPKGTRIVELQIMDDQRGNYPILRLELSIHGHLVSQLWQTSESSGGEGETGKFAPVIGPILDHDSHSIMQLGMSAMMLVEHQSLHGPSVDAAMTVSHTTHRFDLAMARGRSSGHLNPTPADLAPRTGSAANSETSRSAEHGDAAGVGERVEISRKQHDSEVASEEYSIPIISSSGNQFSTPYTSLLETLIAEDVAPVPRSTTPLSRWPAPHELPGSGPMVDQPEHTSQDAPNNSSSWYTVKAAAIAMLSAVGAVLFERRANRLARHRRLQIELEPRVE